MNIPTRPSKGSPPRRAALHERSDSHTNERTSPTLRIIGDPQAQIYASNPFPTKPSQVLSPKLYDERGSTFDLGVGASDSRESRSGAENDIEDQLHAATIYTQPRNGRPDAKEAFYTPNHRTIPRPEMSTSSLAMEEGVERQVNRLSDEIVQLPSVSPGLEGFEGFGTANRADAPRQPALKDSDGSLSSSNSTGTVVVRKNKDGRKRASYSAFPNTARPGSSKSSVYLPTPQKPATEDPAGREACVSPVTPSSPVSSFDAMSHEKRISSVPLYANLQASSQDSVSLQYPVIKPPSASASWYVHFEVISLLLACLPLFG